MPQTSYSDALSISRREVLIASAAVTATMLLPTGALAEEPRHFKQGEFDVTVFSDGHMVVPAAFIAQDAPADQFEEVLQRSKAPSPNVWPAANVPILRRGSDVILFDLGDVTGFSRRKASFSGHCVRPISIRKA